MISIIIPAYQHGKNILDTLKSIFNQSYKDFEIIIVNDGSTDNTKQKLEIAEKKWPNKLKIIHQPNKGANNARNRGLEEAKGNFLFFCDADIILKPDALEKMMKVMESHPEISYVYSGFKFGWKVFPSFDFNAEKLKKTPYISGNSLIRRADFTSWDESLKKFQDWDLWLMMLESGKVGFRIPEILFEAKPREIGISSWLPTFLYEVPWQFFLFKLFKPKTIKNYEDSMKIIKEKHKLK